MPHDNWLNSIVVVGIAVLGTATAPAQPSAGFGSAISRVFGIGSGLADVLRRQEVRKELELIDDQVQKLEELAERRREKMKQVFSGIGNTPPEERFQKMRELFQQAQGEREAEIGRILLPHQLKRLKQLTLQLRLRGGLLAIPDEQLQKLGVTAEQEEKLREKAAELGAQLRREFAELRKQKQEKLLQTLTPAQLAKWKEMVGEPFEFQRPGLPPAGGDRGGPKGCPGGP